MSRLMLLGFLLFLVMVFCMPTYYTPEIAGPSTLTAESGHQYFFQIAGRDRPIGITLVKTNSSCPSGEGDCATVKVSQNNGNNAPLGLTKPATEDMHLRDGETLTLWHETDLRATYSAGTREVTFSWGDKVILMKMHFLIDKLFLKTETAKT